MRRGDSHPLLPRRQGLVMVYSRWVIFAAFTVWLSLLCVPAIAQDGNVAPTAAEAEGAMPPDDTAGSAAYVDDDSMPPQDLMQPNDDDPQEKALSDTEEQSDDQASSDEINLETVDVPVVPVVPAAQQPDEDLFFDAQALVPEGEMGTKGGPSKVNPRMQPGSTLIIVTEDNKADSLEAQLVAAQRAIKLGRYSSALSIYDRLYVKNRRNPNVLLGRAVALQKNGNDEAAIQAYEEFLQVKPDNIEGQVNMLGLMGQHYPAVALQRLAELYSDYPDKTEIVAQMAIVSAQMGHYDDAMQFLGIAVSMEPRNANHLYNLAVIADRAGDKKQASTYYEKALEVDTIYGGSRSIPRDAVYERLAKLR